MGQNHLVLGKNTNATSFRCDKNIEISFLTFYSIQVMAIFIGNLLTIIVFLSKRHLRTANMNVFLISLAISDFFMSVLVFPGYTLVCASCVTSQFSKTHETCIILDGIKDIVLLSNIFNILAITLDRYVAVLKPFKYSSMITKNSITILLVGIWLLPWPLAYMKQILEAINPKIFSRKENRSIYDIVIVVLFVIAPMIIIAVVNSMITKVVRKQAARIHHQGNSFMTTGTGLHENIKSGFVVDETTNTQDALQAQQRQSGELEDLETEIKSQTKIVEICGQVDPKNLPPSKCNVETLQSKNLDMDNKQKSPEKHGKYGPTSMDLSAVGYDITGEGTNSEGKKFEEISNRKSVKFNKRSRMKQSSTKTSSVIVQRLKKISRDLKEQNGTRSCLVIALIFVVCWIPRCLLHIFRVATSPGFVNEYLLAKFSLLFLFFQSLTNPIVYSFYRRDFRKAAASLLGKKRNHLNLW